MFLLPSDHITANGTYPKVLEARKLPCSWPLMNEGSSRKTRSRHATIAGFLMWLFESSFQTIYFLSGTTLSLCM